MKSNTKQLLVVAVLALLSIAQPVHAAITATVPASFIDDASIGDMQTNLQTDFESIAGKAWTMTFLVTGGLIGMGLFKKFTKKGAS